ncbi:hypothetical protein EW026_g3718 [Hermanssonia centrifuga]|uniref:histidine kinase n=1 Tax=Hermanssonia centrifuga TaxID=98765 RepID=A0A4S4KJT0_9APHY|nr:hypothetical protein EW026_g3718 [Hermanssonia centrifuga]
MHRFPAMMGMVAFIVCAGVLIVPDRKQKPADMPCPPDAKLYVTSQAERRLYNLRDQLKIQFRATQKAQVNERKASDSKRRLTSYVFHEVRVPLNTALLAVQNMEASGTVAKAQEIEFKALEGSLSMMSKVLNDVLDFNRMDSGRFESVLKPYAFHKVMRSLFVPLQMATDARDLKFVTDLDKDIDDVARRALYQAMGLTENEVAKRMAIASDRDGIVVGDETRLRQIITNLASNASAFNQTEMGRQQGGKGTGLGLALVRQIVKLSGGRLGVQSKSSEGSTFWVELPSSALGVGTKAIPGLRSMESPDVSQDLVDRSLNGILGSPVELSSADIERHEAQMAHSAQQTRTNSAMHTIMEQGGLVEIPANRNDDSPVLTRTIGDPLTGTDPITPGVPDDASPTQFLQELPRAQNFEFSSRPHGEEYKYAVVFLDNQMPVMSGLELVAKLRELGRHDFVVGVTGNALLADQQEYLEAGVDQ